MLEYTDDPVYKELVLICNNAGISIEYVDLPDGIWGHTNTNALNLIQMSNKDSYPSAEFAAEVLGHELAHNLIDHLPEHEDGKEIEADRMAKALCKLAELTAVAKMPKFWEK